jgi:putative heme-binding domain-containing protein
MLRGFLVAQSADKALQSLVAELVQSPKTDAGKRLLLLEVMQRSSVSKYPPSWVAAVRVALQSKQPAVLLQAVRIAGERHLSVDDLLKPIAFDRSHSVELRAETLIAMSPRLKDIDTAALRWLASELKRDHPPLPQLTVARAIAAAPWNGEQLVELAKSLSSADPLTAPVLLRAFEKSQSETVGLALVKSLSDSKAVKSLPAAELNRLFRKYPAIVQTAAKPLLAKLGVNPAEQERRMTELLKLTDGGNAERGRVLFHSKKAACAGCHTVAGQGGKVGPDLTTIGKIRQPRDLVEALAFPSATIARGFRTYIIVTDAGKIHTGIISRETSSEIVLRTAELAEIRIPRGSIEALRESPTSIMPQGLDKTLSAEELRDLLAYLRSRKGT